MLFQEKELNFFCANYMWPLWTFRCVLSSHYLQIYDEHKHFSSVKFSFCSLFANADAAVTALAHIKYNFKVSENKNKFKVIKAHLEGNKHMHIIYFISRSIEIFHVIVSVAAECKTSIKDANLIRGCPCLYSKSLWKGNKWRSIPILSKSHVLDHKIQVAGVDYISFHT